MMLHSKYEGIKDLWHELDTVVADTRTVWTDTTRKEFDATYWHEMVDVVNDYLAALYELAETLQHIERNLP